MLQNSDLCTSLAGIPPTPGSHKRRISRADTEQLQSWQTAYSRIAPSSNLHRCKRSIFKTKLQSISRVAPESASRLLRLAPGHLQSCNSNISRASLESVCAPKKLQRSAMYLDCREAPRDAPTLYLQSPTFTQPAGHSRASKARTSKPQSCKKACNSLHPACDRRFSTCKPA